ncbi:MAG: hypothetical protein ACOX30_03015 [Dethiobacteria bacterium]|jgi:hypothetical protein
MKEIVIGLSWLDIIFVVFALSSFGWNIVQYVERRKIVVPLKSSLIALFNDVKTKHLHAFQALNMLLADNNPHTDIDTLRWDYTAFIQTVTSYLQGFQEIVVGLLVSVDPYDREGKKPFARLAMG